MQEISREEEVSQVTVGRRHVVIVGAGASRAAFPDGDRNGAKLPLMADFGDTVPIRDVLEAAGLKAVENFEEAYSRIASDPTLAAERQHLESVVFDYFSSLVLPDEPTIYDQLLLGLRAKDVVATFNWDPFLIQAARRNWVLAGQVPRLLFLHGNVLAGYCEVDKIDGVRGARCSVCKRPFTPSRLLFPIAEKNYESDPSIANQWAMLRIALEEAFMVTVFGYGAPVSDASAIDLMKAAWGSPSKRSLEQFEMIDIRDEDALRASWSIFIHSHHYEVHKSFDESWIFRHPRRTGEAYWNQYIEAHFIEDNPFPRTKSLAQLWQWCKPLFQAEAKARDARGTAAQPSRERD